MLKVLIVDDESNKVKGIYDNFINREDILFDHAFDFKEGLIKLQTNLYDLLILDIQLPSKLGGTIDTEGGVKLLEIILKTDRIKKPSHIIGFTAFEESYKKEYIDFANKSFDLVYYDSKCADWKLKIINRIEYMIKWKIDLENELQISNYEDRYDIAIITAIKDEFDAFYDIYENWKKHQPNRDISEYYTNVIEIENKQIKIVLCMQNQMGMTAAATLTQKICSNFRPKSVIMVGITGGRRGEVQLGDIIIASDSWDYGSGKIKYSTDKSKVIFEPSPNNLAIDPALKEYFMNTDFKSQLYTIRSKWNKNNKGNIISNDLNLLVGPIATGAAVVQSEEILADIVIPHQRKVLGLDMETYGVYYSAVNSRLPRTYFMSIKAVSDFANEKKDDSLRHYAAYCSSTFASYNLLRIIEIIDKLNNSN